MSEKFEKVVLEKLNNIESTLDEHTKDIKELKVTVGELKDTTEENSRSIKRLQESFDIHNKFFIRYENEFSEKLKAILDFASMDEEKHAMYDDVMLHYNSKFLNHDIRISALEDLIKRESNSKTRVKTALA